MIQIVRLDNELTQCSIEKKKRKRYAVFSMSKYKVVMRHANITLRAVYNVRST